MLRHTTRIRWAARFVAAVRRPGYPAPTTLLVWAASVVRNQ